MRLTRLNDTDESELFEELDKLEKDIASIQRQLDEAKVRRQTDGVFADPGWYRAAERALKGKRRDEQKIRQELGRRRREASATRGKNVEHMFVQVAKVHLETEQFQGMMEEAKALLDAGKDPSELKTTNTN